MQHKDRELGRKDPKNLKKWQKAREAYHKILEERYNCFSDGNSDTEGDDDADCCYYNCE